MPPKKSLKQKAGKKNIIVVDEDKIVNEGKIDDEVSLGEDSNDESNDDMTEESDDIDEEILDDEDDNFDDDYGLDDEENIEDSENSDDESIDNIKTNKKNDNCVFDFANNDDDDEYEDQEDIIDDDVTKNTMETIVAPEDRITKNTMTSFERVRLLGTRSRQLASGAKPLVAGVENMNPRDIAKIELEHKMTPFKIRRELPNGNIEEWKVSELEIN